MTSLLATKADLVELRKDMNALGADIQTQLSQQENKQLIRMGVMFSFAVGTLITAIKYLH